MRPCVRCNFFIGSREWPKRSPPGGAVAASGGKLYVAAGYLNLQTFHIYDAAADIWVNGASRSV